MKSEARWREADLRGRAQLRWLRLFVFLTHFTHGRGVVCGVLRLCSEVDGTSCMVTLDSVSPVA